MARKVRESAFSYCFDLKRSVAASRSWTVSPAKRATVDPITVDTA